MAGNADARGQQGWVDGRTKRNYPCLAKISLLDNKNSAVGESHLKKTSYDERGQPSRVDTFRKLVIIAVGGKIGNSLLTSLILHLCGTGAI
jgi:hypothetical protein